MSVRNLLGKSAALILEKGNWCQSDLALDVKGRPCSAHTRRARRWDAIGALYKTAGVSLSGTSDDATLIVALAHLDAAAVSLHRRTIMAVNDELGHEAVLECYRAAWRAA